MISAVSNQGAASAAKCIISTAPMAKFGAITQLLVVNCSRIVSKSSSVNPVVPTTAWTPCDAHQARFSRAASRWVKSTATCTSCEANDSAFEDTCRLLSTRVTWRRSIPAWCGSTAATSDSSGSSVTAWQTAAPIRPPAPNTPTRTVIGR